jgi:hypothetical protein
VGGHPGFYYKAVHVEEVTPEQSLPGAGPAKFTSLLPSPAHIPANSPTILAAEASPTVFDDGLGTEGLIYEQHAQRVGKTSLDWMV